MKPHPLFFLALIAAGCFPVKKSELPKDSTQVVLESPTATNMEINPTPEADSVIVLSEFVQDPFLADLNYLRSVLTSKGVRVRDSAANGISYLLFEDSHVDVLINEFYGNLLCSAEINSGNFPMNQGIHIGMSKSSFKRLAEVDELGFIDEKSTGKSFFEYTVGKDNYWRATFWFDPNKLVKVKYEIHPCAISN